MTTLKTHRHHHLLINLYTLNLLCHNYQPNSITDLFTGNLQSTHMPLGEPIMVFTPLYLQGLLEIKCYFGRASQVKKKHLQKPLQLTTFRLQYHLIQLVNIILHLVKFDYVYILLGSLKSSVQSLWTHNLLKNIELFIYSLHMVKVT